MATASAEIPAFPIDRTPLCPFGPAPGLLALQADAPLGKVRLWDGRIAWLVTRQSEQRGLLGDPRISRDRPGPKPVDLVQAFALPARISSTCRSRTTA